MKSHDLTVTKITGDNFTSMRGFNNSPEVGKSMGKH